MNGTIIARHGTAFLRAYPDGSGEMVDQSLNPLGPRLTPWQTFIRDGYWTTDDLPTVAEKVDFFTEDGQVHPIRGSEGYDPELAGEKAPADRTPAHVAEFEEMIRAKNPKIEWGRIWDKDGKPLTEVTRGSRHRVVWRDPGPAGIEAWVGGHVTHFHPSEGGKPGDESLSLSTGDVRTMLRTGMESVRCFGQDGKYMEVTNRSIGADSSDRYRQSLAFDREFNRAFAADLKEYRDAKWQATGYKGWRTPTQDQIDRFAALKATIIAKQGEALQVALAASPDLTVKTGKVT